MLKYSFFDLLQWSLERPVRAASWLQVNLCCPPHRNGCRRRVQHLSTVLILCQFLLLEQPASDLLTKKEVVYSVKEIADYNLIFTRSRKTQFRSRNIWKNLLELDCVDSYWKERQGYLLRRKLPWDENEHSLQTVSTESLLPDVLPVRRKEICKKHAYRSGNNLKYLISTSHKRITKLAKEKVILYYESESLSLNKYILTRGKKTKGMRSNEGNGLHAHTSTNRQIQTHVFVYTQREIRYKKTSL